MANGRGSDGSVLRIEDHRLITGRTMWSDNKEVSFGNAANLLTQTAINVTARRSPSWVHRRNPGCSAVSSR
ncbi:MAG: hypothetical protein H0V07_02830 [Propionibacteriales bacterium]|nr:hypothetical protein [Propionibacteriales bacterium]